MRIYQFHIKTGSKSSLLIAIWDRQDTGGIFWKVVGDAEVQLHNWVSLLYTHLISIVFRLAILLALLPHNCRHHNFLYELHNR